MGAKRLRMNGETEGVRRDREPGRQGAEVPGEERTAAREIRQADFLLLFLYCLKNLH